MLESFRTGVGLLFVIELYRGCNTVYRGTKAAADPSSEERPLAHDHNTFKYPLTKTFLGDIE